MGERANGMPSLVVSTIPVEDSGALLEFLPETRPLLWARRGDGVVGIGEVLRLSFSGATRFTDAASAWRNVAALATVDDHVNVKGSGLIALGAFTFSELSAQDSVLIVPSVVVGRRDGRTWLTSIRVAGQESTPAPAVRIPDAAPTVTFRDGLLDSNGYLAAVETALARIGDGLLEKVVIARDLVATLPADADLAPVLTALSARYPDCWTFSVDGLIGASPETLVEVAAGKVSARVLAGSAARGTDAASDLRQSLDLATSHKDQDEHRFAVNSVVASLRPHSPGVTASESPFTLRLPNLWHLASDVEGELADGSSSLDLLSALHPTAAVAGTPSAAAVALIDELEPFDRGRYAGPVGWVAADGDGEWAIALRCAQHEKDGTIRACAGAGIVEGSVPARELAETSLKFRPIVDAFSPSR